MITRLCRDLAFEMSLNLSGAQKISMWPKKLTLSRIQLMCAPWSWEACKLVAPERAGASEGLKRGSVAPRRGDSHRKAIAK